MSFGYQVLGFGSGGGGASFITATGGNTTITCGDYKTHIFTSTGPLCISAAGAGGVEFEQMDYMVVAGGGGSGSGISNSGGGGGAGGYREGRSCPANYTASPLVAATGITATVTDLTITVGAAGAAGSFPGTGAGTQGGSSVFSTITSAGGGFGTCGSCPKVGGPGGSGGGPSHIGAQPGNGNDPPTDPAQGFPGGTSVATTTSAGQGGGGALVAGGSASTPPPTGGIGGNGSNIGCNFFGPTAPSYGTPGTNPGRYFSGGGGASGYGAGGPSAGGEGGGGAGGTTSGIGGTVNTGGGGGGGHGGDASPGPGGAGGSGFVAIRYRFQ